MALINRHHPELRRGAQGSLIIAFTVSGCIRFSPSAIIACKIEKGKFMQVDRQGKRWFIFFNDDPSGFKVANEKKKNYKNLFRIYNRPFQRYFEKHTGYKPGNRFYLNDTETRYENKWPMFEIMITKPIDKIGKDY